MVRKLVLKYNQNSDNIINGYIMNDNLNPSENYPHPNIRTGLYDLSIKQLTDYKSYHNIPILIENKEYYNQYFYNVKCNSICGINNSTERTVAIAVPHKSNGKYIVHFSFYTWKKNTIGYSCNNGTEIETNGGVIDYDYLNEYCKNNEGINPNLNYYQNYLQQVLQNGYTVISLTECEYDTSSYLPGTDKSKRRR